MQRIAILSLLTIGALVWTGCAGEGGGRKPPDPIYLTRRPEPPPTYAPPAPPPPRPTPAPVPKPVERPASVNLDTASLMPPGGIRRGRWNVIVVHHSESPKSTPAGMDSWHRQRGWKGLGYHLVIGNGIGYPDGEVFVGPRWKSQSTGAHTGADAGTYFGTRRPSNFFNEHGIGICLIGNFEGGSPTPRQMATLQQLIAYLCSETGIPPTRIYGHGEITHKTQCPGRLLQNRIAGLRQSVARALAYDGPVDEPDLAYAHSHEGGAWHDCLACCAGAGIDSTVDWEDADVPRWTSTGDDSCEPPAATWEAAHGRWFAAGDSGLDGHVALAPNAEGDGAVLDPHGAAERHRIGYERIVGPFDNVADLDRGARRGAAFRHVDDDQAALDRGVDLHPLARLGGEFSQSQAAP